MIKLKAQNKLKRKKGVPPIILFLMITFVIILVLSLLAAILFPIDLTETNLNNRFAKPTFLDSSSPHWFGTDDQKVWLPAKKELE